VVVIEVISTLITMLEFLARFSYGGQVAPVVKLTILASTSVLIMMSQEFFFSLI